VEPTHEDDPRAWHVRERIDRRHVEEARDDAAGDDADPLSGHARLDEQAGEPVGQGDHVSGPPLGRRLDPAAHGLEQAGPQAGLVEGVAHARVHGHHERQSVQRRDRPSDRQHAEVDTDVGVHQVGAGGQPRSEDGGERGEALASDRDGQPDPVHHGVAAQALHAGRRRRPRREDLLGDAEPVERPDQVRRVVLHAADGVEAHATPVECRRGGLEHRADP
jgi:hypothetical protein